MSAIPRVLHHNGHADPDGELVLPMTHHFPDFQGALRRFHPQLQLVYDRGAARVVDSAGLWAIAQRQHSISRVYLGNKEYLTSVRPYWYVVMQLAWSIRTDFGIDRYYREPGDWVFKHLGKYKRAALDGTDSQWITDAIRAEGEGRRKEFDDKLKGTVSDAVDDWVGSVDMIDPTKFRTSVRVPEGVPSHASE